MEPKSTPRSTQRLVVSVGAGAEASIVNHTTLTDYVPCSIFWKDGYGISFAECNEELELVARWLDHVKLVNLATRLKGVAYPFYHLALPKSMTATYRQYKHLMDWSTPVQIQSVQSSLFHARKQQTREMVV